MAIDKDGQEIGSRALAGIKLLMRVDVPRGSVIAEAVSAAESPHGTSAARGLAANRLAEAFLDL